MKTIYKYAIHIGDDLAIPMPAGAQLLTVQCQRGLPCVWALVDDTAPIVHRKLAVRGTGHDCAGLEGSSYLGTIRFNDGNLVFHVFDRGE